MDNFDKNDDLYDPNFSIHSDNTEKLDMYGVWLKKKKDTIEPIDAEDSQSVDDFDSKQNQDSMTFDDDFSFSDIDIDSEVPELNEVHDDSSPAEVQLETPASSYTESESSDVALDEDSFESLDLDDFLSDDTPVEEEHHETSAAFVEEEPIDLDFTEIADDTPKASSNDEPPAGLENFSEISLEDFEDAAPADTVDSADGFETIDDFDDILKDEDSEEPKSEHSEQKDTTVLDINVTADDEAAKTQPLSELSSQVVEDNVDIPIFGADDDKAANNDSNEESAFFDDIEAVKQDLLSTRHPAEHEYDPTQADPEKDTMDTMNTMPASSKQSVAEQDKATELLMKIAHEISDLKAELNSLKAGMVAQSKVTAEAPVKDAENHQEEKTADTESSGFFSDDDTDETIALTGDELNNILITADFTEERNSEEGERTVTEESQNNTAEKESENYEVPPVLTKDIDPDMEEIQPTDHTFEESIAESQSAEADDNYKPEEKGEEILASDPVFNVEAAPITSLPEDLSYLDEQLDDTDDGIELINEDSLEQEEATLEDVEEAEPADDEPDFEDINIESFDIPSEQEIEVPAQDTESLTEKSQLAANTTDECTIHELQNDEDFPNPFADESTASEAEIKEEIIEEPFISGVSDLESESEDDTTAEELEELDADSELEPQASNASETPKQETLLQAASKKREATISIPLELKNEIKSVLSYMDQLLEALPEKKIEEFAKSEYFETYKHLFEELGIS